MLWGLHTHHGLCTRVLGLACLSLAVHACHGLCTHVVGLARVSQDTQACCGLCTRVVGLTHVVSCPRVSWGVRARCRACTHVTGLARVFWRVAACPGVPGSPVSPPAVSARRECHLSTHGCPRTPAARALALRCGGAGSCAGPAQVTPPGTRTGTRRWPRSRATPTRSPPPSSGETEAGVAAPLGAGPGSPACPGAVACAVTCRPVSWRVLVFCRDAAAGGPGAPGRPPALGWSELMGASGSSWVLGGVVGNQGVVVCIGGCWCVLVGPGAS